MLQLRCGPRKGTSVVNRLRCNRAAHPEIGSLTKNLNPTTSGFIVRERGSAYSVGLHGPSRHDNAMKRIASLSLLIACCFSSSFLQAADRPNVLLILVDDLKPALGCYGDPIAKTPHLDTLINRGMRFDLAYCNQAVCAPSRFTLMLGSHSTSTGLYGLGSNLRQLVPNAVTMPQYFAQHGYRTESLGKVFHIGHGNHGDPQSFSVPHFKDKVIEYLDPASTDGGKLTREEALFTNQRLGEIKSLPRGAAFESPEAADDDYADGRVAAETIRRLEAAQQRRQQDGTPFFIAAGFVRPHLPFSAPQKYWDLYDPQSLPMPANEQSPEGAPTVAGKSRGEITAYKPVPEDGNVGEDLKRELIHGYYASTSFVDAQIGKVTAALRRLKLDENTIVVLWGDHGFHLGDLGIWTKHTNYEQANRIPICFVAPEVTAPGSSTRQPAETVDIFPTLAELAGLPAPKGPQPIDGVSLVSVLKDPEQRVRDHAFHAYPKKTLGRAIRTERYRLVQWRGSGADGSDEYELYDYQLDPHETKNHATDRPDVVAKLQKTLASYPEPLSGKKKRAASVSQSSPSIKNADIQVVAEVKSPAPNGVVVAQGGREHGYALHFVNQRPAFDVRVRGKVTRVIGANVVSGACRLEATFNRKTIELKIDGDSVGQTESPGLIPAQPKDAMSVGLDSLSAAGDYEAPNPFQGTIVSTRVDTGGSPPSVEQPARAKQIRGHIASHDRAVFVANDWIRDPYIVMGPDDHYYLTGTTPLANDPREASDPYNTGLGEESIVGWQARVWKSEDLVRWQSLGAPFTLKDGVWFTAKPDRFQEVPQQQWRLWAPELHWVGDRWALVHTSPSPVKGANLALSAGADVVGPWTNPLGEQIQRRHDPSLFKDDDGTWWMIWGATSIAPLKPDFTDFSETPTKIGPRGESAKMGHEGCLIQKIHGKYVLFGTGWSTGNMRRGSYNLYYAVADKITGPYSERKFVGRFLGHGTPFKDRQGRWWCTAFYNANVPPISRNGIASTDLSDTAQTINQRGTTLVPLRVELQDGELVIRAKDADYAKPGPDESQQFD